MKILSILTCIFTLTSLYARPDSKLKTFNKEFSQQMNKVIEENPQMYETKPIGRAPASVVNIIEPEATEKLDAIEEHADSHMGW